MSQMYVMQPYGFDKAKIAAIIIGVCSLGVGVTTFLLFYFYWAELIIATIFLTIFLSAGLICIIVAIVRHLGRRQPYYGSAASYYPQSPTTSYQAPPQPAQFYNYAQRPAEGGQPHQHYDYQTPPQYVPQQPAQWSYGQPYQPNLQNVWNYPQRCPLCNHQARYSESSQRWYCERCNQWI